MLRPWADWLLARRQAGEDVYAYFNNDVAGHAVTNARQFAGMLGLQEAGPDELTENSVYNNR